MEIAIRSDRECDGAFGRTTPPGQGARRVLSSFRIEEAVGPPHVLAKLGRPSDNEAESGRASSRRPEESPPGEHDARSPAAGAVDLDLVAARAGIVRRLGDMSAVSRPMHDVLALIDRLAPTPVTVTLIGETGTGKDVLAHAIHQASPRAGGPFVVFDCGAVPPNLVESELFGHERGAFTGALAERSGAFERAHGGTLFLDEIGELPLDLQPRLLRVLDTRSIRRVGGARDRQVDIRIVAATNRDLAALVAAKQFRQDLYFRLAAAVLHVPPLRDRLADLPLLVRRLLRDLGRDEVAVPSATFEALQAHVWPGNVRELKNILACALAFVDSGTLEPRHLRFSAATGSAPSALDRLPLAGHTLDDLERAAIRQTLAQSRGNKAQAAKTLGIAVSTLYEKLKRC